MSIWLPVRARVVREVEVVRCLKRRGKEGRGKLLKLRFRGRRVVRFDGVERRVFLRLVW